MQLDLKEYKPNESLGDLKPGDVFVYKYKPYISTDSADSNGILCVHLGTGCVEHIKPSEYVESYKASSVTIKK